MNRWRNDTAVLGDLRTGWDDNLEVSGGLILIEGRPRWIRGPIAKDPVAVADHLKKLIEAAIERLKSLPIPGVGSTEFYEEVADFRREVKWLYHGISVLAPTFKPYDIREHYSKLSKVAYLLLRRVTQYKSKLQKPYVACNRLSILHPIEIE